MGGIIIAIERTEEDAIIFNRQIDGPWDAIGIKFVCFGFMKLLVPGVAYKDSIRCGRTTNCYVIHIIGLVFGPDGRVVFIVVEVADGEEREPHAAFGFHEHEGRYKFTFFGLVWNHVRHMCSVLNRKEPEVVMLFLFGEVGPGHVDHGFPMTFKNTIQ